MSRYDITASKNVQIFSESKHFLQSLMIDIKSSYSQLHFKIGVVLLDQHLGDRKHVYILGEKRAVLSCTSRYEIKFKISPEKNVCRHMKLGMNPLSGSRM